MKILDELGVATLWEKIKNYVSGKVFNPDDEDLVAEETTGGTSVMKLADRSYSPQNFSGKGYKILRKNIKPVSLAVTKIVVSSVPTSDGYLAFIINGIESHVDVVASTDTTTNKVADKIAAKLSDTMAEYEISKDSSTITLTRKFGGEVSVSSFSAVNTGASCSVTDSTKKELRNIITPIMINQPNTIYEIRYDFDLDGEEFKMPANCCLKFEGGMLKNGKLKYAYNVTIDASIYKILDNIKCDSYFNIEYFYPEWLGFSQSDNSIYISQSFSYCCICKLQPKDYNVSKTISIPHNCRLLGCGIHKTRILYTELPSEETAIIEYSKDSTGYFNHSGGVFDLDITAPSEIIEQTMRNLNIIGIKSYNVITLSCLLFNIPRSILEIHTDNKYIDGSRYDNISAFLPHDEVLKDASCIEINAIQDCLYMNQIRVDRISINNVYNGEIRNIIANGFIQIGSSCLSLSNIHMEENPYIKIFGSDIVIKNLYAWKSNQPNIQISRTLAYQPQRISNIVLENVEINYNTDIVGDNTHVDISYSDANVVMKNCFRSIYRGIRSQGLFSSLSVSDNNMNSFGALKNKEYIEIKKDDINLTYYSKNFTGSETNNDWLHYYAKMFILINDKKNIYLDKTYEFDNSSNVTNRVVSLISSPFTNTICPFIEIYFGETKGVYTKKVKVPTLSFTMFFANDNVNGYKVEDIDSITEKDLLAKMTFVDSYKGTLLESTIEISDTSRCIYNLILLEIIGF